jgi:hypothetical protein
LGAISSQLSAISKKPGLKKRQMQGGYCPPQSLWLVPNGALVNEKKIPKLVILSAAKNLAVFK